MSAARQPGRPAPGPWGAPRGARGGRARRPAGARGIPRASARARSPARGLRPGFVSTAEGPSPFSGGRGRPRRPVSRPSHVCAGVTPAPPASALRPRPPPPDLRFALASVGPPGVRLPNASVPFPVSDARASQSPAPRDGAAAPSPSAQGGRRGTPRAGEGRRCGSRVSRWAALWGPLRLRERAWTAGACAALTPGAPAAARPGRFWLPDEGAEPTLQVAAAKAPLPRGRDAHTATTGDRAPPCAAHGCGLSTAFALARAGATLCLQRTEMRSALGLPFKSPAVKDGEYFQDSP